MNSDDLALFAAVARAGSISRAAMEMGTDQSTVSRRIAALESELGTRLFYRGGRGVTLTERGEQLSVYAQTISGTLEEAVQAMQAAMSSGPTRLRIGAQPTIAKTAFGSLYHAFRSRFPNMQLHFTEGLANRLLAGLDDDEIDVLLLYRPEHAGSLSYDPLLHEGIWLVTPPNFSIPVGEIVPTQSLGDYPLILPSTHHGIRLMAETLAAKYDFDLKLAVECDGSILITKQLVMEGCGCTVLPLAAVIEDVKAARLKAYRLDDPPVSRCVSLLLGKMPMASSGVWQISRTIKETFIELVQKKMWPDAELDKALLSSHNSLARSVSRGVAEG